MKAIVRAMLACALLGPAAAGAAPAAAQDGALHVLIVSGLSGEERFARSYRDWGSALVDAFSAGGTGAANVVWLAERADLHPRVRATSHRQNVERELRELVTRAAASDRILVVFFGHGSHTAGETRVNLPGPDITGAELAALLAPLAPRAVAVVNAASASGGFIQDLAAPNRVVITATRSGMEANETLFGGHFVAALTGGAADTDHDGRVSLLEAFEYARREVEREYQRANRLRTEHATLDGVGAGQGVAAVDPTSPHAQLAATFYIAGRSLAAAAPSRSPELARLHAEKQRLEAEIAALRAQRDRMQEQAYETALEQLLVELSLNGRAIRQAEGAP